MDNCGRIVVGNCNSGNIKTDIWGRKPSLMGLFHLVRNWMKVKPRATLLGVS